MRGVGVVFSRYLEVDINSGVFIGMGIVLFYAILGGMKGITYTQVQAEAVFEEDYAIAKEDAKKFIGDVEVPDEVISVVVEVAFNIGASRLAGFKLFRAAIQDQNFVEASFELESSKLYRQLETRYKPLVELIREA